jgi:aspartyl/asparaginyl-tRNA synthetase
MPKRIAASWFLFYRRIKMFEGYDPLSTIPDNSKAGITVCLNQNEGESPFEATVYFKKSGKGQEDLRKEGGIVLSVSGKLRLDIGKNGSVEIFAEKTGILKEAEENEVPCTLEESKDEMPIL